MKVKADAAILSGLVLGAAPLRGGSPLIVDDTGIVDPGQTEVFAYYTFEYAPVEIAYAFPVDVTRGFHPRMDLSLSSGYQFLEEREVDEGERVHGMMDTILAVKFLVGDQGDLPFHFALEGSIKLPTAPSSNGLGSGDIDVGLTAVATREWESMALDVNVGYLFAEHFRGRRRDGDEWLLGVAVRRRMTQEVELFGEGFFEVPVGGGNGTIFVTRAGANWEFREDVFLGGALGTGWGTDSPDLVVATGVTSLF